MSDGNKAILPVSIRVRGYHLDAYQHVNNARYLEFWRRRVGIGWRLAVI